MAAVQHESLALIYGAETWRATPLLVVEFLAGGTLADRLRDVRLRPADAVQLGLVLSDVLARIHDGGVPKLLDFGLAQMVQDSLFGSERTLESGRVLGARDLRGPRSTLVSEGIAGTPLHMSPEPLFGGTPEASLDLWSAAIVVYEAMAGRNPFARETWEETLDAITQARAPDVREQAPDCPAEVDGAWRLTKLSSRVPPGSR